METLLLGAFGAVSGGIYYFTNRGIFYHNGVFDFVKFNYTLSVLHAAAAAAAFVILRGVSAPVYLDFDLTDTKVVDNPDPAIPFDAEITTIKNPLTMSTAVVSFYLITAVSHLIYATLWRQGYLEALRNHHNPARWIEYSISATIMVYIVSIVSGVRDVNAIIPIVGANAATMYTGYIAEEAIRRGDFPAARHSIQLGWALQLSIYVTIFRRFAVQLGYVRSIKDGSGNPKYRIPPWLFLVLIPTFVYYGSFGVVATIWYNKAYQQYQIDGTLPSFESTERQYLYLSLFSKLFLGLYISYGYSRRGDLDDITA